MSIYDKRVRDCSLRQLRLVAFVETLRLSLKVLRLHYKKTLVALMEAR